MQRLLMILCICITMSGCTSIITTPIGIAYDVVKFPLDVVFD
jgi:uncharacterized protein YceK